MQKSVPWLKKAEDMKECVALLESKPLSKDNFSLFYTPFQEPYRVDVIEQLVYKLNTSITPHKKFILTGQHGVGKSTELQRMINLCTNHKIIFINAADAVRSKGKEYINLLLLIANEIIEFNITEHYSVETNEAFSALLNYLNLDNSSLSINEVMYTVIDKNDMLYVQALNNILSELESQMGDSKLLIVIDGLDKVRQYNLASDVFNSHVRAFTEINADMVFTCPIHLLYNPQYLHVYDTFDEVFRLGAVELMNEDKTYDGDIITTFKELVYKRVSKNLIDEDALRLIIRMSGGLIRDILTLLCDAALVAGVTSHKKISVGDVEKAIVKLSEQYVKFIQVKDGFSKLVDIYKEPFQQVNEDLCEFLRVGAVLEYSNNRYTVHPIVLNFLRSIGKLVDD